MRPDRAILTVLCVMTLAALPCFAQPEAPPADEAIEPAEAGDAAEVEPVLLRFDYEEGEKLTYETTVDGVGSVHVMGQAQPIDMTGSMQVVMTIEEIDEDGNYVIVTDVDIAELSVTLAGSPVAPPKQEMTMRTTMSPRGEILNLKMEQAVDQPNSETPWNSNITKMLTGGFDLNRMLLGQRIAAFPEEAVKPGDEWKGNAPQVELQGQTAPLEINTKYDGNIELEGRECARLDSSMAMHPSALGELATMLGMEGATTNQTRTWFDLEAGCMFATMEKTQVSMQVNLPAEMTGAQDAATVFLEMFIDTESKLLPSGETEEDGG